MRVSARWSWGSPVAAVWAAASRAGVSRMSLPMTRMFIGTAGRSGMGAGGGGGAGAGGGVSEGVGVGVGLGGWVWVAAGCASWPARFRLKTATPAATTSTNATSAAIQRRRPRASIQAGRGELAGSDGPAVLMMVLHLVVFRWDQCPPLAPLLATYVSKLSPAKA